MDYRESGSVKYNQVSTPKMSMNEELQSLHREFGKQPAINKTKNAYRQKSYCLNKAELIRKRVNSVAQYVIIHNRLTRPPLQNPREYVTGPEDAMPIYSVRVLPPSSDYENIVGAMDVFSRYLSGPTTSPDAN